MEADAIVAYTALSPDECQRRIATAESNGASELVGYSLSSQVEVTDGGDRFEVRNKFAPAMLVATVSQSGNGSIIRGRIEVPAQGLYRLASGFVVLVAALVLGTSAYDLAFGTHRLLTRSRTELGPGHPASIEQHLIVFLVVPILTIALLAIFWPKARPISPETAVTLRQFVQELLDATDSDSGQAGEVPLR
jgi:lysylphosphatidylglycerol synthetase-like protein (DUF2156 family)